MRDDGGMRERRRTMNGRRRRVLGMGVGKRGRDGQQSVTEDRREAGRDGKMMTGRYIVKSQMMSM